MARIKIALPGTVDHCSIVIAIDPHNLEANLLQDPVSAAAATIDTIQYGILGGGNQTVQDQADHFNLARMDLISMPKGDQDLRLFR